MTDNKVPLAEYTGYVEINGRKIPCAVLYPDSDNPIRVFWQREIVGLLTGNKKGGFERYLDASNLQRYLPDKFREKSLSETVMPMRLKGGRIAQAFEATDLIDICQMYMRARTDSVLLKSQIPLATQAEIIVFAFAKLGVVAMIDEATSYQYVRDRLALNKLLDRYIDDEKAKVWAKKFPDDFYREIFRLNNWDFNPTGFHKRPGVVGKWTKDLIYARFPKPVLTKLEDLNPMTADGYRQWKHHQFLTEDVGNAELQEYISNCIFLMKSASNWRKFNQLFARAMGQEYQESLFEVDKT